MCIWGFHEHMEAKGQIQAVKAYLPTLAKEKEGLQFENSKGRKATHLEMEKQIFGKQMFSGPSLTMGHRNNLHL